MRFSIVIPTYEYNGLATKLLDKLIESINQQTFNNFEIIIVDHSLDNVIENYLESYPKQ